MSTTAPVSASAMPDKLSPNRLWRKMLAFGVLTVLVAVAVLTAPGLGELRHQIARAEPAWLLVAVGLEVLSALSYVVTFRAVFCPAMSWRLSYQIGMSEQAANAVLSVSGTGGLALGAWALRRGGMSAQSIGRKSVAFFLLTSLANVFTVFAVAALYAVGILQNDRDAALTYGFGAAALLATLLVLALPSRIGHRALAPQKTDGGRLAVAGRFLRRSLREGVPDAVLLLRRRSPGVVLGSLGVMGFDLAVLGACFIAFGHLPPLGVLALGYLIGQLGGNLPTPGGVGGVDLGLIGVFVLYHQPVAVTTAAVLVYHAISLWIPGLLGSVEFVRLRRTLQREEKPEVICTPLAEWSPRPTVVSTESVQ